METAQRDVERFVEELSAHGILLVSDCPFPESSDQPDGGRLSLMQEMGQRALDLGVPMSSTSMSLTAAMSAVFTATSITTTTAR